MRAESPEEIIIYNIIKKLEAAGIEITIANIKKKLKEKYAD